MVYRLTLVVGCLTANNGYVCFFLSYTVAPNLYCTQYGPKIVWHIKPVHLYWKQQCFAKLTSFIIYYSLCFSDERVDKTIPVLGSVQPQKVLQHSVAVQLSVPDSPQTVRDTTRYSFSPHVFLWQAESTDYPWPIRGESKSENRRAPVKNPRTPGW